MFLNNRGVQFALATAFISGVANFVNKFAVDSIKPPLVFTATKNIGVGLLIIGLLLALRKLPQLKTLTKKQIGQLVAIGIIGGSIPFYLYFTGLSQIPAVNAAMIHKTLVLWVALLAVPFLKEKLTWLQIVAVIILFGSNAFVGGFAGFKYSTGELMVVGATIFWAIENIIAKKVLTDIDPDIVTAARMGFGSVILMTAAVLIYPQKVVAISQLTSTQWLLLAATAATLFGYVMTWYRALKYAPATLVTSVLVGATLVTNVLSAIFVTHAWNGQMGIQAGMMVLGITVLLCQVKNTKLEEITVGKVTNAISA